MEKSNEQIEFEKKALEQAEMIKSLRKVQSEGEDFDKIQKSDPSLEDLRK